MRTLIAAAEPDGPRGRLVPMVGAVTTASAQLSTLITIGYATGTNADVTVLWGPPFPTTPRSPFYF